MPKRSMGISTHHCLFPRPPLWLGVQAVGGSIIATTGESFPAPGTACEAGITLPLKVDSVKSLG